MFKPDTDYKVYMKIKRYSNIFILIVIVVGIVGYFVWYSRFAPPSQPGNRKVLFYQGSMHPWVKSDHPAKCTICGMDLTPVYEGEKGFGMGENTVALSSNNITVLDVQTEDVRRRPLDCILRVAGTLEANETRKTIVAAPSRGRIDALAVPYAGAEIKEGEKLINLFSPELLQQRRYLFASRLMNQSDRSNDVSQALESDPYTGVILAPQSGIVTERNVYNGQYVVEGENLFTIVDPSVLWFRFDVYEQQLPWLKPGQAVEVTVLAVPGKKFPAAISFMEPTLNEATRTIKVRADIKNPVVATNGYPQRLLRFGMYAEGIVQTEIPDVLAVPRTAILFPGASAYAYVDKGTGAYERRRVKLGRQGDKFCEILQGLEEGERVVTTGNVLIDAQAQFNQDVKPEESDNKNTFFAESASAQCCEPDTAANATASSGSETPTMPANQQQVAAIPETAPTNAASLKGMAAPAGTNASSGTVQGYRDSDRARMAISEKMRIERWNAINAAGKKTGTDAAALTPNQRQALTGFFAVASGISQALASDDLNQFNRHTANLPAALAPLQNEFGAAHRWNGIIQRLSAMNNWQPAKDLAQARQQFLPFSTATAELAKQLRKGDPSFAYLKIYHCPMAPKPGLWMQTNGPLHNPFYGSQMPKCGNEVME